MKMLRFSPRSLLVQFGLALVVTLNLNTQPHLVQAKEAASEDAAASKKEVKKEEAKKEEVKKEVKKVEDDDEDLDDMDNDTPTAGAGGVLDLTDDNFKATVDEFIAKKTPIFVKFFAPWCGHCKQMAPAWEELGNEAKGAQIAKVDLTQHDQVGKLMKVRGFPTLYLFSADGMYSYNGPRTKDALKAYAEGGYKKDSAKNFPWNETILDQAKEYISEYLTKVGQIAQFEPTLLPLVFILGALFSAIICFFVCAPQQQPQRMTVKKKEEDNGAKKEIEAVSPAPAKKGKKSD